MTIHSAALNGDVEAVKRLIQSGASIEATDEDGKAPLHLAAENGEMEAMKLLLERGANIEAKDETGTTPLHYAGDRRELEAIRLFAQSGANMDATDEDGKTPLHRAAFTSNLDDLQFLMSALSNKGNSAAIPTLETMMAGDTTTGNSRKVESMKLLLDLGANIEAKDENYWTPFHCAALSGDVEVMKFLMESGANIETKEYEGRAPLHDAAANGDVETMKFLLESGANIEATDNGGGTPLHCATIKGLVELETAELLVEAAAVKFLLESGANVEAKDGRGDTPLHNAAWQGHVETMKFLVEFGANIEATAETGKTPLHRAAEMGKVESIKFLLNLGANIDAKTQFGWTPLHFVPSTNVEALKLLLDSGADIEAVRRALSEDADRTPIHLAAEDGEVEVVEILIEAGANIGVKDQNGNTPLHHAAEGAHLEVVKLLVQAGANIEAENTINGETPYQVAFAKCRMEVADFLKSEGAVECTFHRDDFDIDRQIVLGQGGFGTVFKARDTKRRRDVAVKVCKATDSARLDLKQESVLLQTLKHGNIVQHIFYHFDEELSEHQVFMELQEYGSLASKLNNTGPRNQPMRETDIHDYLKYMLQGLAYLHERGVIHRDIKPGNALIAPFGIIKLADFGCSTSLMQEGGTITTEYVEGTAPYRAPEVFRGEYSQGTDLWAVACCVVEMATARRPWGEIDKVGKELERHIRTSNSHPQIPDHLTPELKQILTKMFHQDPKERGSAKGILLADGNDGYFGWKVRHKLREAEENGMDSTYVPDDVNASGAVETTATASVSLPHFGEGQSTSTDPVQRSKEGTGEQLTPAAKSEVQALASTTSRQVAWSSDDEE